jgi:uracil-DNA glycosylase
MIKDIYKTYWEDMKSLSSDFDFTWEVSWKSIDNWSDWIVLMPEVNNVKGIIIWEAPGKEEVIKWLPFQWQAGKNLRWLLKWTEWLYITNTIKYRPFIKNVNSDTGKVTFSNRTPSTIEIDKSSEYLFQELVYLKNTYWCNKILLVWNSSLKWIKSIIKRYSTDNKTSTIVIGDKIISLKELDMSNSEILNKKLTLSIDSMEFELFPIYHTSPLVFNFPKKRLKIEEWIENFLKEI